MPHLVEPVIIVCILRRSNRAIKAVWQVRAGSGTEVPAAQVNHAAVHFGAGGEAVGDIMQARRLGGEFETR